jgi:hypothetical protein
MYRRPLFRNRENKVRIDEFYKILAVPQRFAVVHFCT